MNEKVAVLLTCHNRKDKTLLCLENLIKAEKPLDYSFDVYLVDDGSVDGTSLEVIERYPKVEIIQGDGTLFWNKGMRLAWETAAAKSNYDYYLWLNDDSFLLKNSILHIFECYNDFKTKNNTEPIITGACCEDYSMSKFSYGLRRKKKKLTPNGKLQQGNMMNGNMVLVSKMIFESVGNLSESYTHAMGDYDYGLRAIELGFKISTTKQYIAICESNKGIPNWRNPHISIIKRWKYFHSPLGLNIKEYKTFRKRFWKDSYYTSIMKVYLRCFFPLITNKIKQL